MAVFRKLYQPLCSCNRKFYKSVPSLIMNTRKIIPLNVIVEENTDIYEKILKEDLSNAEWQNIRERLLQIQSITPIIIDSTIIDMCLKGFQLDKAIAYFKFLRENNYPLNVAIIGKYLRLYILKAKSLTEADKMEITTNYNILREKHPYLDSITAEHCIISLCLTDHWEKVHEIIDMMKLTTTPGTSVYSALASAAFRNDKPVVAWKALSEIVTRNLLPQIIVYTSHLEFCEREGKQLFNDRIEDMFEYWAESSIKPYNRVISAYADVAGKYGWSATATTISKLGKCAHCSHSLSEITFSEETYQKLVESVMSKVIIGKDIYQKSNPEELQRFKKFIDKTKPYDIVIDGLNMMYMDKKSISSLIKVIDYFRKREKKMLVLSRKHQNKFPGFEYVKRYASYFLTDNLSADDPYMLYATMASGNEATFVSLDLLRQHKHMLQDVHLQREFKKWQYSHQYFILKNNMQLHIQQPFVYLPTAQKNNNNWHIPYVSDDFTYSDLYEFPDKWYCFQYHEKE